MADVAEREGGATPNLIALNDFGTCIMDCGLNDVGFQGLTRQDFVQSCLARYVFCKLSLPWCEKMF